MSEEDNAWKELAWWATDRPRPKAPELIPGLSGVNRVSQIVYQEQLVGC
jgi:hypothetical protein